VSAIGQRRHHSRERALEILYEASIKGRPVAVVLEELNTRPDEYALTLVTSAEAHRGEAESMIEEFAIDWPLERLALIDRLVMTLAVGEMLTDDAPPAAVILDEAVELAKVYSTESSSSFVNGVLSSIAHKILG
jgi:N utilization substance protein B